MSKLRQVLKVVLGVSIVIFCHVQLHVSRLLHRRKLGRGCVDFRASKTTTTILSAADEFKSGLLVPNFIWFLDSDMRIVTWNINGLRSLGPGKDLNQRLLDLQADIICVQETKVTRNMLERSYAILSDFTTYYSFSRKRTGYSGVATFCRLNSGPILAEEGLAGTLPSATEADAVGEREGLLDEFTEDELKQLDAEGRCVITSHETDQNGKLAVIINVYCPQVSHDIPDPARAVFKQRFYKLLTIRAHSLMKAGHHVIIVGDINTSHREIDHCDPSEDFAETPGRQWLNHFLAPYSPEIKVESKKEEDSEWKTRVLKLQPHQFVDSFRHFHPLRTQAFTCWNTRLNCRSSNYGTRLDYVFVSKSLVPLLKCCDIHPDVLGSDHCPVSAEFTLSFKAPEKVPSFCTRNYPEFKLQNLSQYFVAKSDVSSENKQVSQGTGFIRDKDVKLGAPPEAKRAKSQQMKLSSYFSAAASKSTAPKSVPPAASSDLFEVHRPEEVEEVFRKREASTTEWKTLFSKGPPEAPLCRGHGEAAVLKTVKKKGANCGRQFWGCPRGEGRADDPQGNCHFFKWLR